MSRNRRSFSPVEKADAVRKHLVDKVPVSQIADQMQVQPTLIHNWVNTAVSQLPKAFESPKARRDGHSDRDEKVEALQKKLAAKNEVISELMEENIRAKKANGEP